jgi:hypothetical protein
MKKLTSVILLLFMGIVYSLAVAPPTAWAAINDSYQVSGAGTAGVNGIYTPQTPPSSFDSGGTGYGYWSNGSYVICYELYDTSISVFLEPVGAPDCNRGLFTYTNRTSNWSVPEIGSWLVVDPYIGANAGTAPAPTVTIYHAPSGGVGGAIRDASGLSGAMQGMAAGIVLIIVNAMVVFFTSVMGIITVLAVCVGLVWFFIRKTRHAGGGYNHYHAHGAKNYKDYLKKTNLPF